MKRQKIFDAIDALHQIQADLCESWQPAPNASLSRLTGREIGALGAFCAGIGHALMSLSDADAALDRAVIAMKDLGDSAAFLFHDDD